MSASVAYQTPIAPQEPRNPTLHKGVTDYVDSRRKPPQRVAEVLRAARARVNKPAFGTREAEDSPGKADVTLASSESANLPAQSIREDVIQRWEGRVTSLGLHTFTASLVDVTAGHKIETEEIELPYEEIQLGDVKSLRIGSIFVWLIGHRYNSGSREKFVRLIVRRLPAWTRSDLENAREKAANYSKLIEWE